MKCSDKLSRKALILAVLVAIVAVVFSPVTPVYAYQTHTWDTKADFDAGVLNNVDTSYSPNDVVLGINLNTGNGSDGALTVTDGLHFFDAARSAVSSTTYDHSYIEITTTAGFAAGQEILIIQMEGTGAGNWETNFVGGTGLGTLILTRLLQHTYYADGNSKAQVIKIPNYTNCLFRAKCRDKSSDLSMGKVTDRPK